MQKPRTNTLVWIVLCASVLGGDRALFFRCLWAEGGFSAGGNQGAPEIGLPSRRQPLPAGCQFPAVAPERHGLMIGIGVVAEIRRDGPPLFRDPAFHETANGHRPARADVDDADVRPRHRQIRQMPCRLRYRQVVPQLFAARHVEGLFPPLDRARDLG